MMLRLLTVIVWSIPNIINGRTIFNPTITDSSGDYFISQRSNDFTDGEINCNSDTLCHIQCTHSTSCQNIDIHCNNATLCTIDCKGYSSCDDTNFYIGSTDTSHTFINCVGSWSCYGYSSATVYNNNLGKATVSCADDYSCDDMQILDINGGKGYNINSSNIQIFCMDGVCDLSIKEPYPLIVPSIINSSGEYYSIIASYINIECSHNSFCHIQCVQNQSCIHVNIHCNNATSCIIDCKGINSCLESNIYAGSHDTIINCNGEDSCGYRGYGPSDGPTTVYTQFKKHPLSKTYLACTYDYTCNNMQILDIEGGTGYASNFKIFCQLSGGCNIPGLEPFPSAVATVYNETGEYYLNTGSYVNITCRHNSLCSIDCNGGSCYDSIIDCGDAAKCMVLCGRAGHQSDSCEDMEIVATNIKLFDLRCYGGSCDRGKVYIDYVDDVIVTCEGDHSCYDTQFNISLVNNVQFECNGFWAGYAIWNIEMVDNVIGNCIGGACHYATMRVNDAEYFDLVCGPDNGYTTCSTLNILSYSNMNGTKSILNLDCTDFQTCKNSKICIESDDILFNLDCSGKRSCEYASFCDETDSDSMKISCSGDNACIGVPTPQPTSIPTLSPMPSPTSLPTSKTLSPSSLPTLSPTRPTATPTSLPTTKTLSPTASTTLSPSWLPTKYPTLMTTDSTATTLECKKGINCGNESGNMLLNVHGIWIAVCFILINY